MNAVPVRLPDRCKCLVRKIMAEAAPAGILSGDSPAGGDTFYDCINRDAPI